jgi:uncharacterized Zn finger protein (UPF0148 family)
MVEQSCPWCEEIMLVEADPTTGEESCPVCLTSWRYVEEPAELAAAA